MLRDIRQIMLTSCTILAFMGASLLTGGASKRACAFTNADADTTVKAYLNAFTLQNGASTFIKGDQNGGDPGFWQEAEEIEGIEDANNRTGGAYNTQVTALLNGFSSAHGTNWSYNIYNDDIAWATIAYVRGYQATGNVTFRTIAKNNFDLMFARAWDPAKGALFWTTDRTSYNSCIESPAAIAAYLLYQALNDSSYLTKAQTVFNWEKANLYNASTGAVLDAINTSGEVGTWASTYNQGTFVGAANFLGDVTNAKRAANYTMYCMGDYVTSGYRIMPQYGSGGDNNSGLNSIGLRWISKFMMDRNLQSTYLGWLQANANTVWAVRRTSDNLSWCQWLQPTPGGVLHSWDCINSVVALQVVPAGNTPQKPYFMLVNQSSSKALDLIQGNTNNGTNGSPIVQYDQQNNPLYKWQFMSKGDGFYGVFSLSAPGRVISLRNASSAPAYSTQLWDYNPSNVGDQKVRIVPRTDGKFKFFFKHDSMSWDMPGGSTANNLSLQQFPDNNSAWQTFGLEREQ